MKKRQTSDKKWPSMEKVSQTCGNMSQTFEKKWQKSQTSVKKGETCEKTSQKLTNH